MLFTLVTKYTLIEAYKRKLWVLFLCMIVACFSIGLYAKSLSIIEGDIALIGFYAAFVRVCSIFIVGLYLIVTEIKTFEDARIQLTLALPINRFDLLVGKICAYSLISLCLVGVMIIPMFIYADAAAVFIWSLGLLCELTIMIALGFVLVLMFNHPVFAITVYAVFYLFSRSASEFYAHSTNHLASDSGDILAHILSIITYIAPKLDRFASAEWLMYEANASLLNVLFQTFLYAGLLMVIALRDIQRKSF